MLGLDKRKPGGWENIGLWVKEGRSQRRLGAKLDRTFFLAVVTDLQDFRARSSPLIGSTTRTSSAWSRTGARVSRTGSGSTARSNGSSSARMPSAGGSPRAAAGSPRSRPSGTQRRGLCGRGRRPPAALRNGARWLAPYRRDPERHSVPHRDGHELDAWLIPPRGRRSRGLVLHIHGGPHLAHGPSPGWR